MSNDTFEGLRPVAHKRLANALSRQTRRIVLPSSTREDMPVVQPPVSMAPPPLPVVKKKFSLMPVAQALLRLLPNGIQVSPVWTFIGSNPSMELPAFPALVLQLNGISSVHAAVTEFNEAPFVVDLGSTNGTRVFRNQTSMEVTKEPVALKPGDIVYIGPICFRVEQS